VPSSISETVTLRRRARVVGLLIVALVALGLAVAAISSWDTPARRAADSVPELPEPGTAEPASSAQEFPSPAGHELDGSGGPGHLERLQGAAPSPEAVIAELALQVIRRSDRTPIAHAVKVILLSSPEPGSVVLDVGHTDGEGCYRLGIPADNLPEEAIFHLSWWRPGFADAAQERLDVATMRAAAGQGPAVVELDTGGTLVINVVDNEGRAVRGAQVSVDLPPVLSDVSDPMKLGHSAFTNVVGQAILRDMPTGSRDVVAVIRSRERGDLTGRLAVELDVGEMVKEVRLVVKADTASAPVSGRRVR
jgi:hypothetical protein